MVLGTTSPLGGLLRKSPFTPIQEHMRLVFSCVCVLPQLFDALYVKDEVQIKDAAEQISTLETDADKIKSTYRLNMPKSLLMPVDRKDLLSLIGEQDNIADAVEEISQICLYRDMDVPEQLKPLLDELLEGTMEIATDAKAMIEQLDELLEVGFGGGRQIEQVQKMIATVRRSEHNIDSIVHRTRRTLFAAENEIEPVSVMFWYKIIDLIEQISNLSENMADRILLFLSK